MTIVLAEYFNANGKRIYQVGIENNDTAPADTVAATSKTQGAAAVQALLVLVTNEEVGLPLARKVRSVSVDGMKPIGVNEVMSDLETRYGASSVQWARAVFAHMKLRPPTLQ